MYIETCFVLVQVEFIRNQRRYSQLCVPYNSRFERRHAAVHDAVGGHLSSLTCAPSDPFFFLLHAGVDYYFELFLDSNNHRVNYPRGWRIPNNHGARQRMRPFEGYRWTIHLHNALLGLYIFVYYEIVHTVLLYASKSWTITQRMTARLQVFVNKSSNLIILYTANLQSVLLNATVSAHIYTLMILRYTARADHLLSPISRSACLRVSTSDDIAAWMLANRLQLNTGKTDMLWCATAPRRHQLPTSAHTTTILLLQCCCCCCCCSCHSEHAGLYMCTVDKFINEEAMLILMLYCISKLKVIERRRSTKELHIVPFVR